MLKYLARAYVSSSTRYTFDEASLLEKILLLDTRLLEVSIYMYAVYLYTLIPRPLIFCESMALISYKNNATL